MFKSIGSLGLILILLSLSGCGIVPWYVTAAHTAADVVLQSETGKTSTEILASELTKKECKWARFLDNAKVCMTKKEYLDYILSKNCKVLTFDFFGIPRCKD